MQLTIPFALTLLIGLGLSGPSHAFSGKKPAATESPESQEPVIAAGGPNVWVFRADGSRSCSPGTGQSLQAAQQDLIGANVHVLDARKGSDGRMHAMYCGADSGAANTYLIPRTDLPAAMAIGFQEKK